jgi:hypothetical protein
MSGRLLGWPSLAVLALFALAAPVLAKTNASAISQSEAAFASLTHASNHGAVSGSDATLAATEFCCFRCGGGGYSWGCADCGYGYYPYWGYYSNWWGYWPGYYAWGWPYYYGWNFPATYYWWQYPWWSNPSSTYYWWYRAQSVAPAPPIGERPPVKIAGTPNSLFSEGVTAYWDHDYAHASELLSAAVAANPRDARFWYYKALAERAVGNFNEAQASARRGAALEVLRTPEYADLGVALERVQGADRHFLHSAMTADLTRDKAEAIASEPVKRAPTMARSK